MAMTDPYRLCPDAYCPHCGVKGKIVSFEDESDEDYAPDDGPQSSGWSHYRTCVACRCVHDVNGMGGMYADNAAKQYGRLVECRPYEPPVPVVKQWKDGTGTTVEALVNFYKSVYSATPWPPALFGSTPYLSEPEDE